jgi:hypothetical protein
MSIQPFVLGYPPDGSSLGNTKVQIRNNLDGTFLTLSQDHVNNNGEPGTNTPGYHTIIHEVTQARVDNVTGVNQVFSGVPGTLVVNGVTTSAVHNTGDTQLYSLTGNSSGLTGLSQLTGSVDGSSGYQWIGSFLMQWGFFGGVNNTNSVGVGFTIPFPRATVRNIQITNLFSSSSPPVIASGILNGSIDANGFTWVGTKTTQLTAIYWMAIGF